MKRLETVEDCRAFRKVHGNKILGLVPTMGALHEAHLRLIRLARQQADTVVVSLFVNPLQFGPGEDFDRYPRPLASDLAACEAEGVEAVFLPSDGVMHPDGPDRQTGQTRVVPPPELTEKLCGLSRPVFFSGVATVVLKLFNLIQPDIAVFGEKDAQQLAVVRKMVRDLNLPVEILTHPTVREETGLALSSRNTYLKTDPEKQAALIPSAILRQVQQQVLINSNGPIPKDPVFRKAIDTVLADQAETADRFKLEYLDAVDPETFETTETLSPGTRLLIAGHVGSVRLIDNLTIAS